MSVTESILLATGNPHKLAEIAAILRPEGVRIEGLDQIAEAIEEPVEDGRTFLANALIKARWYAHHTGRVVLADDSGLVVDALGGAPGVSSARYAGAEGPRSVVDAANNAKLLDELRDVPEDQRTARFVCVMVLSDAERTWAASWGTIEGCILGEERGPGGFGYDPLFHVPELGRTTAELAPEHKNAISHRGQAARRMAEVLRRLRLTPSR